MPEISVESAKEPHGYGITAEDTPWCKQGILSVKQVKESEDEQTLADIAASVLLEAPLAMSKELLDILYDSDSDDGKRLEQCLVSYGEDRLAYEIKATFSVLREVIEAVSPDRNYLRKTVRPGTAYPIKAPFYAIFMAFFDLVVRQQETPDDARAILKALDGLDTKLTKGAHYETTENRTKNIDLTKGLIARYFVKKEPPALGHGPSLVLDLENAIRRSRIEAPRYELKQGLLRLDEARDQDAELPLKLVQTVCAIANIGPEADGFIYIGVADKDDDAKRIETLDGVTAKAVGDRYIVGLEREAAIQNISLEQYVQRIVSIFQNCGLSEPLKGDILANTEPVTTGGLTVVRIRIPKQAALSFVGEAAYRREGSSNKEIKGPEIVAAMKSFAP